MENIGGVSGQADGAKVVEPVMHALITPTFSASITWSGRSKKNTKKVALSKYTQIVNVITSICNKADNSYTPDDCLKDIKYKVIKHAQGKFGQSTNGETTDSTDEIISVCTTPVEERLPRLESDTTTSSDTLVSVVTVSNHVQNSAPTRSPVIYPQYDTRFESRTTNADAVYSHAHSNQMPLPNTTPTGYPNYMPPPPGSYGYNQWDSNQWYWPASPTAHTQAQQTQLPSQQPSQHTPSSSNVIYF